MLLESLLVNHKNHYSVTHIIMHLFLHRCATIVRVTITDFMQCRSAEFRPEPDLYMFINHETEERMALNSAVVLGLGGVDFVSLGISCVRR